MTSKKKRTSVKAAYVQDRKRRILERERSFRHRQEIKIWMLRNGVSCTDVAKAVGVSPSLVSHFLARACRRSEIIEYLVSRGCPRKHFDNDNRVKAA